jgi:hypothetical protein
MDSFSIIPVDGTKMVCACVLACPMWFESDPKYHPFKEYKKTVFYVLESAWRFDWFEGYKPPYLKFSAFILQEELRKTTECHHDGRSSVRNARQRKGVTSQEMACWKPKRRKSRLCYAVNFGQTSSIRLASVFRLYHPALVSLKLSGQ